MQNSLWKRTTLTPPLERNLKKRRFKYDHPVLHLVAQVWKGVAGLVLVWAIAASCSHRDDLKVNDFKEVILPADFPQIQWIKLIRVPTPTKLQESSVREELSIWGSSAHFALSLSQNISDWWIYRQPNFYNQDTHTLSVYYQTNKVLLDKYDLQDMENYLNALKWLKWGFPKSMVVSSYADTRWTSEGNQKLSDWRNEGVNDYLKRYFARNWLQTEVKLASFGSSKATAHKSGWDPEIKLAEDRRVEIYTSLDWFLAEFIKTSPADIYLVDGSSSMNIAINSGTGKTRIQAVQGADFKTWSVIYIFRSSTGKPKVWSSNVDIRNKETQLANGWTPLYEALLLTMQQNPWKSITLISDGEWDSTLRSEDVIMYAKKYNCTINIGAIQIPFSLQGYFRRLAQETGGRYAIIQE